MAASNANRPFSWTRGILAAALALLVALALAACGGDGEQPAGAEEPLTEDVSSLSREEVISQGDSICAEVYAATSGLEASGATPAMQMSQRADLYEGMVERLRGLDREDPGLTEVFAAGRDLVQAAMDAEESASQGDAVAAADAEDELDSAVSSFRAAAAAYGFTECGEAGEAVTPVEPADGGEPTTPTEPAEPVDPGGGAAGEPGDTGGDSGGAPGGAPAGGGTPDGVEPAEPEPGDGGGGEDGSDTGGFSPG